MSKKYFIQKKKSGKILTVLTAYDAPTAELLEDSGVDIILVGDSLGMVLLGYPSTTFVTMNEMIHHAKAVRRGAKTAFLVGDLPLKGIQKGPKQALGSAKRFIDEAGLDAVKLEWGPQALKTAKLLSRNKIMVMGHVGLTPQSAWKKGGFKVQGKDIASALEIIHQAIEFEKKGAFCVLLECVPSPLAAIVTKILKIPTVGIGAGPYCDGQVLVYQDLMGIFTKFKPRFVKQYAEIYPVMKKAVDSYVRDVKKRSFPSKEHSFTMIDSDEQILKNEVRKIYGKRISYGR